MEKTTTTLIKFIETEDSVSVDLEGTARDLLSGVCHIIESLANQMEIPPEICAVMIIRVIQDAKSKEEDETNE